MISLHVVIPTYNRAGKLKAVLTAIRPLMQEHYVTVYDNCSTDGTRETALLFEREHEKFSYVKRGVNIGGNGNILNAAISGLERGDMLWILPDDDHIDEDGIQELLFYLHKLECDKIPEALIVGACSSRAQATPWPLPLPRAVKDGIGEFWMHASFLPTIIFGTKSLRSAIRSDLFYVGGCYSQMLFMRHLLDENARVESLPKRIVFRGEDETVLASVSWWMISWIRAMKLYPSEYRNVLNTAVVGAFWEIPFRFIKSLSRDKRGELSVTDVNYSELVALFDGWKKIYIIGIWPVALLPKKVVMFLLALRKPGGSSDKVQSLGRI